LPRRAHRYAAGIAASNRNIQGDAKRIMSGLTSF
jgi:hypothetical protein